MKKKSEYSEKFKDPRWQKKRLEIFERDKWTCQSCEETDKSLHVHHIFYVPKKEPWEYPNGLLITLCEDCHKNTGCGGQKCSDCPDYRKSCDGPGDAPGDIISAIDGLLNFILSDKERFSNTASDAFRYAEFLLTNGR